MAPKKKQTGKGRGKTLEEKPKTRPRWKNVLLSIYNHEPISKEWEWDETTITDDHPLAKKLGISGQELAHSLCFLKDNGLIESRQTSLLIELTQKGFDVALKVEEWKETRLYRLGSLMFSGLLSLTLATTLIYQMNLVDSEWLLISYIIAAMLLWAVVSKLSHKKPLIEIIKRKP